MYSYENPDERVCVLQLNSELQHAQLELLSAHCATHQLRLHYSADDLARFGRHDVLRKSAEAASALHDFYSSVQKKIPATASSLNPSLQPTAALIAQGVEWLSTYLREQREYYLPVAGPLSNQQKALMRPHFSPTLLDQIRVVELQGARVAIPDFFTQIRALGFEPPEISHMDSLTFLDVIAFNEQLSERSLFHALVHTVQIQILGLERYAELWVTSFIKTRAHFTVPLEVHAFSLASRFLRPAPERFSVEDQVRRWEADGRY
jgi:hypothetical protein